MLKFHWVLPSVGHRHNAGLVLGNVLEDRLREVEVVLGRVAPAAGIVGEGIVWRAEIGGGDHNGAGQAPLGVVHTPNLVARSAPQPIVEQSSAQGRRVGSVPLAVEVAVPTSSAFRNKIPKIHIGQRECLKLITGSKNGIFFSFGAYPLCQKRHRRRRKWLER